MQSHSLHNPTYPQAQPRNHWAAKARQIWRHAIVLPGHGPWAVVTFCGACIVSLHADYGRAWSVKEDLDWNGCVPGNSTRCCKAHNSPHNRHLIFDLRKPFARTSDGYELWREVA
jgi:hypothetical protein